MVDALFLARRELRLPELARLVKYSDEEPMGAGVEGGVCPYVRMGG
jgi:hypothetical protein